MWGAAAAYAEQEEEVLARQGETQLRGLQPLPAWQGETLLRGLQPVPARQAEDQLHGVQWV
jgi:hypothetical protein